jgi:hypothetical protein
MKYYIVILCITFYSCASQRQAQLNQFNENARQYQIELKAGVITQADYDWLIKANNELYQKK